MTCMPVLYQLYCGRGQRWSSSLIMLYQKCPPVSIGSCYREIGMNLPGSPRGFWVELDNPKGKEIKKDYSHGYPLFCLLLFCFVFAFPKSFPPFFSAKRTPLLGGWPTAYSLSGMALPTLLWAQWHGNPRSPLTSHSSLLWDGYESQVVPMRMSPVTWDKHAGSRGFSAL